MIHKILLVLSLSFLLPLSAAQEPITRYQVLFSPEDSVATELISLIEKENKSIKAAIYCLTHYGIANALMDAHVRGVDVQIIVDPTSIKARSAARRMGNANLSVFVWNPPATYHVSKNGKRAKQRKSLMHDKFCVLGDRKVWTGSFNFSIQAASNSENVLILESSEVASRYLKEFERLKQAYCSPIKVYLAEKNLTVPKEKAVSKRSLKKS
jgi:phosphatidylserine/phosphatidylglycerophosphate/cardiolipin synthase-like enzyme